jgi:hypothetical protein
MNDSKGNLLACNNDTCMKNEECLRFKLFKDGADEYKSFSGNPQKGCGKFVKNED